MGEEFRYENAKVETTDWEDVLVRKNIIPERKEIINQREVQEEIASREFIKYNQPKLNTQEKVDQLYLSKGGEISEKDIEQLEEEVASDEIYINKLREMRLQQLKSKMKNEIYGQVIPIHREDFIKEVTEASSSGPQWVVVELFKDGIQPSTLLSEKLRVVASRQKSTKFVKIRADECIENWPDRNVPAMFLYNNGTMKHQIIGLDEFGGVTNLTVDRIEWILGRKYALFTISDEIVEDPFAEITQDKKVNLNIDSSMVRKFNAKNDDDSEEDGFPDDRTSGSDDEW